MLSNLFGQVWFWSLLAFLVGAVLTWVLLVRPTQQRAQQLEDSLQATPGPSATPVESDDEHLPASEARWPGQAPPRSAPPVQDTPRQPPSPWLDRDSLPSRGGTVPEQAEAPPEPASSLWGPSAPLVPEQAEAPSEPATPLPEQVDAPSEPAGFVDAALNPPDELTEFDGLGDLREEDAVAGPAAPPADLPKRRRGASNKVLGGFEPPRPIRPSVRPVLRRSPTPESHHPPGSLFEPTGSEALPPGPFGPASAMPLAGGGRPADEFTVKASVTALRYCTEDSPQFGRMVAEVWFVSASDAEQMGFRPLG